MRGIIGYGAYVPFRRLDRADIKAFLGTGGGSGSRAVASYDEDTTTMGVEAARNAMRGAPVEPDSLWFTTTAPAYAEKTNATAIHAALRLDGDVAAFDLGGAVRSGSGALRTALEGGGATLVVASDIRTGLPGSADEGAGGDAAAAILVGDGAAELVAEYLGGASATAEFIDRWRAPGDLRTKQWEEKFGEVEYVPLVDRAWNDALKAAGVTAADVDRVAVVGPHARAGRAAARTLGVRDDAWADDLAKRIGQAGAAQPALAVSAMLETAASGEVIALVALADGVDVIVLRATDAIGERRPSRPLAGQIEGGGPVSYAKFLSWRGLLPVEPPRRPEPARVSASAAARADQWKYGFVGSRDRTSNAVHLPPTRVSMAGGAVDDMEPLPMADTQGTIVTFTVDRMAYSPSPPVVFAVVDFDGGGRLPIELTDVDESEVSIGGRVEMTFRRLNSSEGIHNYFWKARPVRDAVERG